MIGKLQPNGIGATRPKLVVYIANKPDLPEFELDLYRSLQIGEAASIIAQTSNHWRKVFSILAKLSSVLYPHSCCSWQNYRDTVLLTSNSYESILFDAELDESLVKDPNVQVIVSGFTHAKTMLNLERLQPIDNNSKLLLEPDTGIIVAPYFDWRQLNNKLLDTLVVFLQKYVKQ